MLGHTPSQHFNPVIPAGASAGMSEATASGIRQHRFDPYDNNGGSILAIAGEDFCIVAADTRQSTGYHINSRYAPKAFKLNETAAIASSGFYGDITNLNKRLQMQLRLYKSNHQKDMPVTALAQMLSGMLYQNRFFPIYSFNIVGGIDEQGRGAVFHFDVVGSFQREWYRADGTGQALMQPFLDNQLGFKNQQNVEPKLPTLERAIGLARDAFNSTTERDIYTGDQLEIFIFQAGCPVRVETFPLKKD
ncbi:20S proteasome subunit beta 6, partial [Fonticula alba]